MAEDDAGRTPEVTAAGTGARAAPGVGGAALAGPDRGDVERLPGGGRRRAATCSGRIAVLLAPLAIALAATIFLTALLDPVLLLLRRLRLPAALAALLHRPAAARHPGRRRRAGVEPDRQPVRPAEPAVDAGAANAAGTS